MSRQSGNLVGNQENLVGSQSRWAWLLPFPWLVLSAWSLEGRPLLPPPTRAPEVVVADQLARGFGLSASPSDVVFIDPPPRATSPWTTSRAWVLAAPQGSLDDVFLARVRRAPEGAVLEVRQVFNLTDTEAMAEGHFAAHRGLAAFSLGDAEQSYSLELLDADRGPTLPAALSLRERWQLGIAFWQETGQRSGVARRHFKLDPPAKRLWLGVEAGRVRLWADGKRATLPAVGAPEVGGQYLDEQPGHTARPGNLTTWAVDRVRALPWFGDERMQLLKAIAYRALDELRVRFGWFAEWTDESQVELPNSSLPASPGTARAPLAPPASDDERSWPPPPLNPVLDPPLPGEGEWLGLEGDPFVRSLPNGESPVLTTFVRTDPEREFSRIVVTLWDSRVTELSMQSGTEEPKSQTGEHGTGLIPRDPDLLGRLVLAFNGGFQGTHGDFGMMVERAAFVPPKPFAATVARLADGNAGFGTWPTSLEVPAEITSFRQNLTPLIVDGRLNPYDRLFWGGAPEGWEDRTRTVRSGLCLTTRGHIAYLYGASVDHVALAAAMQRLDCEYGMHLDMNQGHTGLEFYTVAPASLLPTLGLPLESMWQAEGDIEGLEGFRFRGRRLFKTMQLMNFPRYIRREGRDFFYVTRKTLLPGKPLPNTSSSDSEPADGAWNRIGLVPEHFPFALMRSAPRPDPARPETKVHALEIDPGRVAPAGPELAASALFAVDPGQSGSTQVVWLSGRFTVLDGALPPGAVPFARGHRNTKTQVSAAMGLRRGSGFLVYAEVGTGRQPDADGQLLLALLERADCHEIVLMEQPLSLVLADQRDLRGHPVSLGNHAVTFQKSTASRARRIFTETPFVDRATWGPLQRRPAAVSH